MHFRMQSSSTSYCTCGASDSLLGPSGIRKWSSENHQYGMGRDPPQLMSKGRILKNIFLLCISHYLVYQTGITLGNLQSTMNEGIGLTALAVQYAMALVCVLFLSDILIRNFGCKKMLVLMITLQLPYHASNLYPAWWIIVPSSALSGVTIGLILMGVSLYLNEMSLLYFWIQDSDTLENITSRFNGIFAFFALNSSVWGNLFAYFTLYPGDVPEFNRTNASCGINFDGQVENDNLQPPSDWQRDVLVGVCLSWTVLSIFLMAAFVDELDLSRPDFEDRGRTYRKSLLAAIRHASVPDQVLLMPLSLFFGIQSAFFIGDFTKAYVACSWGVYHIGSVTMCYGVCGAIMGVCVGPFVKRTSQPFVMVTAAILDVLVIVFLTGWDPSPDFVEAYFIVAGIWGMFDAIWWSQLGAIHGVIFVKESAAAYSIMYFCVFLGFAFNFSTSEYLSMRVKINMNAFFLVTGMAGYLIGQIRIRLARRRTYASSTRN